MATSNYTAQEFLTELKAHDWAYNYASGKDYSNGYENSQRLRAIASGDDVLQALYQAYRDFVLNGAELPTVEEKAEPTADNLKLKGIMKDAWRIAYRGARRFGGSAKSFMPAALKQAWAKSKAAAVSTLSTTSDLLFTICVDETVSRTIRRINMPVINQTFTDREEAATALEILSGAFNRPFIKMQMVR